MQATLPRNSNTPLLGLLAVGILINLVFAGISLVLYPALLGNMSFDVVIMTFLLLLLYALLGFFLTSSSSPTMAKALRQGTLIALIIGGIEVVNISIETFVSLPQQASTIATLSFMGLLFFLFGVAGFVGTRQARTLLAGLLASVWCAMGGILLTVLFGFSVSYLFADRFSSLLASDMLRSRSGLTDIHAFTAYNTFDSASNHLLEGPILALLFGLLGAMLAKGWQRWRSGTVTSGEMFE